MRSCTEIYQVLAGGGLALVAQNPASYRNTIFSGGSPQISGAGASSLGNNLSSDGAGLGAAKVTVVYVPEHLLSAGNEDNMLLAA